jgi:small ligand-binding sensory domain FIST
MATCASPDAALAFVTGRHGRELGPLLDVLQGTLGTRAIVGATAHGVVGAGQEVEASTAVSVLALEGLDTNPFLLPELGDSHAGEELTARVGLPQAEDLVILLPDPIAFRAESLLQRVREDLGSAAVVGAGAVEDGSGRAHQWCGDEILSGALAGLVVRGAAPPRVGVTQACRPVTDVHSITRTQGNWILEIDGRPALDVYRKAVGGALLDDLRRAAMFVLAAFPRSDVDPLSPGRYLVRHLVGFSEKERALAVPERVEPGDPIAFVHREPETAREDLKEMLAGLPPGDAVCGVWLDCCARGAGFFGVPGLEAAYLEQALGSTPVAGMLGSCEIGPVAERTELLTYTGVLALIQG